MRCIGNTVENADNYIFKCGLAQSFACPVARFAYYAITITCAKLILDPIYRLNSKDLLLFDFNHVVANPRRSINKDLKRDLLSSPLIP